MDLHKYRQSNINYPSSIFCHNEINTTKQQEKSSSAGAKTNSLGSSTVNAVKRHIGTDKAFSLCW